MTRFRRLRFFLKWCLAGLVGMVLLVLCSDWWLPSVVPAVLKQWDVQVASVARVEGGRWECSDVRYEVGGVVVSGDVVRMPSPRRYLQAYWQEDVGDSLLVEVGQLSVVMALVSEGDSDSESGAVDVVGVLGEVRAALSTYDSWMPAVEVGAASIVLNEAELLSLQDVSLRAWRLAGVLESSHFAASPVQVEADLRPDEAWRAHLNAEAIGLQMDVGLRLEAKDRLALELSLIQGEETLNAQAAWLSNERWPNEVQLKSDAFSIQRSWFNELSALRAEHFHVSGLDVSWGQSRYQGSLALAAELPVVDHEALGLRALLSVSGDFDVLSIENCEISGTWGKLTLSNTLEIDLGELAVLQGAELTASLDLEKQAWIPAMGHLDGRVVVAPDSLDGWDVNFDLNGKSLSYGAYEADGVSLAGEIQGSMITLERLQLDLLNDTEADRVSISGVADWDERTMDLKYEAAFGADWLNAQLGENYFADELKGVGRVFGSFDAPELEGVLEPVTLLHSALNPVTLEGEVRSLSEGAFDVDLSAKCEGAELLLDLSAKRADGVCSVQFEEVVLSNPDYPTVQLVEPFGVTYRTEAALGDRLEVEPLQMEGGGRELRITWAEAEGFSLLIRNMSTARLDRWLKRDVPLHQIDSIDVALTQLRPKVLGRAEIHAQTEVSDAGTLRVDLVSRVEREGIVFEELELGFEAQSLLSGSLALPLRLQFPNENESFLVQIPGGHLSGDLTGKTTPAFSKWLAKRSDVTLGETSLSLSLSGFWTDPKGALDLTVERFDVGSRVTERELPDFTNLTITGRVGTKVWEVERFNCLLNGSVASGSASLPTSEMLKALDVWPAEPVDFEVLLQYLTATVELQDWKFTDWRHLFPEVLRQSGELDASLELKPGLDLSGRLVLDDFALRPTQAYSMIDQIGAELVLADHKIDVKRASARVGGSPVTVDGWIDGTDLDEPLWELSAVGERVPLVRTNDLILRSDVDLVLKRLAKEDVPELSGELNFTQSTLLVEFDPLAPSVETGPSHEPPYFSITTPAIADWKFDVVGKGDAFFRVRSPYFRALVSANLALGGTFIKPELVGSLRVASGDILFPSVKMELDSGEAFIELTRPNEVQLDFSGIAQVSSYVITMEVEQTLDDPSVYFSSTPTLPNSEIVRLLATGGLNGGEVGAVGVYLGKGLLGVGAGGVDSDLADRLTIDVGEAGGRDGGNTFGVQYRITDRLSVKGGYDIYEAHNLDLIWSVFKR